jgi:hypothetical protein
MLIIRETTGSDLGPETGYPDRFFMLFPSPSWQIHARNLKFDHDLHFP